MVLDYRKEGAFFGGTPLFTGEPYTSGARTVKETECYLIPQEILRRAERNHPNLSQYFLRMVHSRVRRLYSDIVADHNRKVLTQIEAYPFKKRLSEIMVTPVESCPASESAQQVARRLSEKKVSSILVLGKSGDPVGIITEKDIVAKVLAPEDADPKILTAGEIMTPHPHALPPETYMFEAMAYMNGHRIKHLPVIDRTEVWEW